jgi:hypothetical protein
VLVLLPALLLQVWPSERHVHMRCSAGCVMVWHQECWRRFQDGYEQETRGGDTPHGINITQVRSAFRHTHVPVC